MNKERKLVLKMLNSYYFDKFLENNVERGIRSNAGSENVKKMADESFYKETHDAQSHELAWHFYTTSITCAEEGSETRARGYNNRSAILLHISKFEESIRDIDRALKMTKDDALKVELLVRKSKCLHALESDESQNCLRKAEFFLNKVNVQSTKTKLESEIGKARVILKKPIRLNTPPTDHRPKLLDALLKQHEMNDFSSVEIQSNETYGRHLVAAKDFHPGDVIFIEKPYIHCMNLGHMYAYCSYCFQVKWTNIPCDHCSWNMFCSEECKKKAWEEYHDIECSVYACAKQLGNSNPQQIALRVIILELKKHGSLKNLKAELEKFYENPDFNSVFMQDGKIKPDNSKAVYLLAKHISKKSYEEDHEVEIAKIMKSFGQNTSVFGEDFDHRKADNYRDNEDVIFLGTLFLTLSKIAQNNSRQMWNHRYNPCKRSPLFDNKNVVLCLPKVNCCSVGNYLAPVTSLLNHSCYPNARVCYASNYMVIVYATRPIKKGEQIFDCYISQFHEEDIVQRQKLLSYKYNLKCDCIACQKRWPFGKELANSCGSKNNSQIFKKYKKIMAESSRRCKTNYDDKIIGHLRKGIEEALQKVPQPSFETISLIHCLQRAYEQIYGISLDVPETCNNI